jgi:hypothetical protein
MPPLPNMVCGRLSKLTLINARTKHTERWTKDELIIVLYFTSRCIGFKSISQLLSSRGFQRSPTAIKNKVYQIVHAFPSLRPSAKGWDKDAVDQWLDDTLGNSNDVDRLIAFTPEDAETVAQVGYMLSKGLHLPLVVSNLFQHQPIDRVLRNLESCLWRTHKFLYTDACHQL